MNIGGFSMKKALAFLLAAALCLGLLAGCGKSAPPYFPFSQSLRLDATQEEIIEEVNLQILKVNDVVAEIGDYEVYENVIPFEVDGKNFKGLFFFRNKYLEQGLWSYEGNTSMDTVYSQLVKYFSKIYGMGKEKSIEELSSQPGYEGIDNNYQQFTVTFYDFKIDSGIEYELVVQKTVSLNEDASIDFGITDITHTPQASVRSN